MSLLDILLNTCHLAPHSPTNRPIEALGSADNRHTILARWRPAYTSHLSGVHRLFINWHIQVRYHDYYYH